MQDDPGSIRIIPNLLVANILQLTSSILNVVYNNIYSKMLTSQEFDRYSHQWKGLRVSERPKGAQGTSRFFITQSRYAIPLLSISALLHWLPSKSFFLVRIDGVDTRGIVDGDDRLVRLGYSAKGIIAIIVVACVMMLVTLALGVLKRLSTGLGEASNSVVQSPACHIASDERDIQWKEIGWVM
ncbi:MAG: hypothetical protein MMC23_004810 [Stictis urceolatum]|nr:hypothetical protein [Stictis urceolata]